MVQVIRNDLEFILQQIKIAEADARGEQIVGTLVPTTELPWGLRHVDGSNNNLRPGQETFGAANQQFPRALDTRWVNEGDDGMKFGPPIMAQGVPCYQGSCSEVYLEKAFDGTGWRPKLRLPVAKALGETSIMFLVHPTLTPNEVHQTCQVIRQVMAQASN
jgi:hypothetical protein